MRGLVCSFGLASTAVVPAGNNPAVRRSISLFTLLFAWLCANGSVWDVVQVVAWGKMFAGYAQTLSFGQSVRETMDPDKPCRLCLAVSKARAAAAQNRAAASSERENRLAKLLLNREERAPFYLRTTTSEWAEYAPVIGPEHIEAVPVPPPRAVTA